MKNRLFFMGMTALLLSFGLVLTGCNDSGTNSNPPAPTVTSVTVSPATASVVKGGTQQFSATVTGTNNPGQGVTWSIEETNKASGTSIDNTGKLTVDANETPTTLTVKATSTVDTSKSGTATVTVYASQGDIPTVTSVTVSPATASVVKGGTQQFSATVTGTNNPATTVTWSVTGGGSGTSVSDSGLLTVGANESATPLIVKATSDVDDTKSGTASVTVTSGGQGLLITNIGAKLLGQEGSDISIAIVDKGVRLEDLDGPTGTVAAAGSTSQAPGDVTFSGTTVIGSLYAPPDFTSEWTGSGAFDIYLTVRAVSDGSVSFSAYRVQNVTFSSGAATVPESAFLEYEYDYDFGEDDPGGE